MQRSRRGRILIRRLRITWYARFTGWMPAEPILT